MWHKITLNTIVFFSFSFFSFGQEILDLDAAVAISLANNYDLKLAEKTLEKSANNQSIYNSGFLPTATLSGNGNYANSNLKLTDNAANDIVINDVATKNYSGSVGINYLIFNGTRKVQYDQFKKMYELADVQQKRQVEVTLINVYNSFFNVARNQEQKYTLEAAYQDSKERLERVKAQFTYGKKSKLDVLNATVDANSDSIQILNINLQLIKNKRTLNFLLGRDINYPFEVNTAVVLDEDLAYEVLYENMLKGNMQLKESAFNMEVLNYDLKKSQSNYLPSLSTSVSYGLNYGDNGPTTVYPYQVSNGLSAGLSLSWNIFDGGTTKVRVQNAKIDLEAQVLNEEILKTTLESQLANYWTEYITQKIIIRNEELNVVVSEQNFLKSNEQFDLGQISSFDNRQAQLNLINTQLNLLNAKYNAKLSELQMKIMTANLIK
ncbi:TolC family protein [Putridiphycobacter roseus]|uniref:TolC family protein n=1 Tax=Putridiphycobacter roseus TaxID=2219161 RepID=A0A2W1MZU0_9FLAO|nr:TolC family protein [Putridiphycobacter roseus]PZE17447.1 TolC family protein [Putridiphycobacter roseus]